MYPVPRTFQEVIVLVSDRDLRRPSGATCRLVLVIVTGRFRKQIAVFSQKSVQAVRWLPRTEHSPKEREREREREREKRGETETETKTHSKKGTDKDRDRKREIERKDNSTNREEIAASELHTYRANSYRVLLLLPQCYFYACVELIIVT